MKTYVMTTGALFGLLTVVHLLRMFEERQFLTDPWYLLITAAAAGMCVWSCYVLRPSRRS
jgi:NO-binding membrane sensor protein with MHYT domain